MKASQYCGAFLFTYFLLKRSIHFRLKKRKGTSVGSTGAATNKSFINAKSPRFL